MSEEILTPVTQPLLFECTTCGQSFPPAEIYNQKGSLICIRCFALKSAQATTRRNVSRALASVAMAQMIAKAGAITLGLILLLNVSIPIGYFEDNFWWHLFEHARLRMSVKIIGYLCGYVTLASIAAIILGTIMMGTARSISLIALAALPILCMAIAMPLVDIGPVEMSAEILALTTAAALLAVARCRWVAPLDPRARKWQLPLAICLLVLLAVSLVAPLPPAVASGFPFIAPISTWAQRSQSIRTLGLVCAAVGAIASLLQLRGVRPVTWFIILLALAVYLASPFLRLFANFADEYEKYKAIFLNGPVMFAARACSLLFGLIGLIVIAINETLITAFLTRIVEPEITGAFPVLDVTPNIAVTAPVATHPPIDPPLPSNPPPI